MLDWRASASYMAILAEVPPQVRVELEACACEIAEYEIDVTDAAQWEALAEVFVRHGQGLSDEDHLLAVQLAACMMHSASRLRAASGAGAH